MVLRIHERALRWLRRHGLVTGEEPFSNDRPDPAALDVFSRAALGVGRLDRVEPHQIAEAPPTPVDGNDDTLDARFIPEAQGSRRAAGHGWSLHAGTNIARGDRDALERLLRYFTRPPLAQARLFLLRDGRIAYELRKPWRRDQTHRIMTPLELMARLAALIPPPRAPLLRFHGCFAPNASFRRSVVPVPTGRNGLPRCDHEHRERGHRQASASTTNTSTAAGDAAGDATLVPDTAREDAGAREVTPDMQPDNHPDEPPRRSVQIPRSASPWRLDWATRSSCSTSSAGAANRRPCLTSVPATRPTQAPSIPHRRPTGTELRGSGWRAAADGPAATAGADVRGRECGWNRSANFL